MSRLCYIDTETTGLDARIHQPYEVSYWLPEKQATPSTWGLPHSLDNADASALRIGNYFERGHGEWGGEHERRTIATRLIRDLRDVTLIGSNPSFDAAMLTRFIGAPVWHHRMIDVSNVAMVVFDEDRPLGLAACTERCRDKGYEIPEPDHTAEGDVRTTRAVYEALRDLRRADA